jgi:Uma2 family endonuclease
MGAPSLKQATYADVLAAPDHLIAELIDGVLAQSPRPMPRHAVIAHALGSELNEPFRKGRGGPGGWIFAFEPELHLGEDVLVPDIAGWRRERLPVVPKDEHISTAPDWVCEILSPSTERLDRNIKMRRYAKHDVAYIWLVDPRIGLVEAFQLVAGKWLRLGTADASESVGFSPFDAISFPLSDVLSFDAPPAAEPPAEG